jgi:hypothetical protein
MFLAKVVEKIKTHFMLVFFFENFVFYELMWKSMVEPDRSQVTT